MRASTGGGGGGFELAEESSDLPRCRHRHQNNGCAKRRREEKDINENRRTTVRGTREIQEGVMMPDNKPESS